MTATHTVRPVAPRTERGHLSVRQLRRTAVLLAAGAVILVLALVMKDAGAIVGALDLGREVSVALVVLVDVVAASLILLVPSVARVLIVPRRRR
ncbi:hypothetical protein ASD11_17050 [Aeromicrobium sp. Root495]|uniref:hypothetical protein n=1 Tax=Aeromicrobium sp. Root495 TaxID=1736550 RepID=UPI0006FCA418|nr:hypothetical protein [Aeromicrobium sp. Root495]KQY55264.1 hypothetical protein ASD11_17050 [Aeromicrobium sp. Root495]